MEDVVSKLTPDILVSPSMYIHFITTLSKEYCNHFSRIEEKRNRFEKVIQRMENIVKQVSNKIYCSKVLEIIIDGSGYVPNMFLALWVFLRFSS